MTPADIDAQVSLCHSAYCKLTGMPLRMGSLFDTRKLAWQRFVAAGFTFHDVELVLTYLKAEIRAGRRLPGSQRFSNLIENLERFEEEAVTAKAVSRNQKPVPLAKDKVLAQARPLVTPSAPVTDTVKTAGSIIPKLLAEMRAAVETKPCTPTSSTPKSESCSKPSDAL